MAAPVFDRNDIEAVTVLDVDLAHMGDLEADAFVGKSEGLSCLVEKVDSMLMPPIQ